MPGKMFGLKREEASCVGPCHHSMACPQIVDRGDSFQIWRVAVNVWISSCGQMTRSSPPAWGLCNGLMTPHHRKSGSYEVLHMALEFDILWNDLGNW